MQDAAGRIPLSIAPILPPPLRRWARPLDPALHRLLIPDPVSRAWNEARRSGLGAVFARRLMECLEIRFAVDESDLALIPSSSAAMAVCNHPFGIAEGLILVALLDAVRRDYKVVANSVLSSVTELRDQTIFVNPFETAEAGVENRAPLRAAIRWLTARGLLVMFPAGEVAHLNWRQQVVTDPPWKTTAARIALRAGCPVVPIFFEGANSIGFHLAGALHPQLRTITLAREFENLRGRTVRVRIGNPIPAATLRGYRDAAHATEYLRSRTYFLSNRLVAHQCRTRKQRSGAGARAVAPPAPERLLAEEVAALPRGRELAATSEFAAYIADAQEIPSILHEIGRCRELAFRAAGEGTGKAIDLDCFDNYYRHLFLWSRTDRRLAGAYRLAVTTDVLGERGIAGLYTSTLFRFHPDFFEQIGPAVELGRSFVVPEYQRSYAPLFLLWKAITRFVQRRPEAGVLFGAVSISRDYHAASRGLMATYLSSRASHPLAPLVRPRRRFRNPVPRKRPIRSFAAIVADIDDLSLSIADVEGSGKGVPVLLRQYLRAGGRCLGFSVDPSFSDTLDALLLADIRNAPRALLERCMGRAEARAFLESRLQP